MDRDWTDKRMDDFAGRVDRFEASVDRRFDMLEARMDRIDARLDRWGRLIGGGVVTITAAVVAKLLGA